MKAHILVLLLTLICSALSIVAQNPNFDFSQGNFNNWNRYQGIRGNCCTTPTNSTSSHKIITTSGNDPVIGSLLPQIPSGLNQVARIGSPGGGASSNGTGLAWSMDYDITIDANNPILFYQTAVVGDGTHSCTGSSNNMPLNTLFNIALKDQNGQLLSADECYSFDIEACSSGNLSMTPSWNTSMYFPWSSVGIDLTPYIGQTITFECSYYTCYYHGYHGSSYAYIAPDLIPKTDTIYYCKGENVVLEGLPRFNSYLWSNGIQTQLDTVEQPTNGAIYSCTYQSFNGCSITRNYVLIQYPVDADFSLENTCVGKVVQLSNTSSGDIIASTWDFGDGTTLTDNNPMYTFSDTGFFDVTLIVESTRGCLDTAVQQIQITPSPNANFYAPDTNCFNTSIAFNNTSSSNTNSFLWDFGDGNTSSETHPFHSFSGDGNYTVTLIASTINGCLDTMKQTITIQPQVIAEFAASPTITPLNQSEILFTNLSQNAFYWLWNFGDGATSEFENPVHTYTYTEDFTTSLVVQNEYLCSDTFSLIITIIESEITIPNVITPNGDGLNDFFTIETGNNLSEYQLTIFNRWGKIVYQTQQSSTYWDGTYNGKKAPEGTYFYTLKYAYPGIRVQEHKGHLTLIR
ncbi:MAG: hypothetical protein CL843_19285 [Crocinitomicaceae bacterium]|nr:hypothetical protein [Crocinitomicaceae bacterium]|tara:strand:- start:6274 stop:8163 length:1890 start_codon:yes stop_codon:yes gene_type:complete